MKTSSNSTIASNSRIIFALDVDNYEQAMALVNQLGGHIQFFKVGLQLFLNSGFTIVDAIVAKGFQVMLDLKFYDIPQTVALAVKQLTNRGISFATIHGNDAIIKAAVDAKKDVQLLAVTVLTSFDESDMTAMGMTQSVSQLVKMRAKKAIDYGCDGVVASPLEVKQIRQVCGNDCLIVTPGIRPKQSEHDDQVRVATVKQAIINGASYLVIGRPIKDSQNPKKLVESMIADIEAVQN